MKNNLSDLNNHLFATLEMLENDELDQDKMEQTIKRTKAVCQVSSQILKVASLQLSALKTAESCGLLNDDMPALLATKDSKGVAEENEKFRRKLLGAKA